MISMIIVALLPLFTLAQSSNSTGSSPSPECRNAITGADPECAKQFLAISGFGPDTTEETILKTVCPIFKWYFYKFLL